MNTHKHARLTYARRLEMVKQMLHCGLSAPEAASRHGVTPPTARKWLGRFLAGGDAALADASSRPLHSPKSIDPSKALLIVELRRRRMIQTRIALSVGVSEATVSRVLARAGLSKLSDLDPIEPVRRYEHEAPGDLLHIDTKKLGRIVRPSHRVTGNRKDSVHGAGWEMLFIAIDDHARIAFTAMHPDEKRDQAVLFLRNAVRYYATLGIAVKRLLTDNGSAFRSGEFKKACADLGIIHKFTKPYRPQTNGKAERFIQSALREWAYGWTYQNSAQRTEALADWQHHYNWHRPHSGIGGKPPMSRLSLSGNNLLTVHTYCALRLGPDSALWRQLDDDPKRDAAARDAARRLRELCALPFNLHAQCDLTLELGRPAQDRAELFGGLAWLRLQRAFRRHELDGADLLDDLDRRQLADATHWKQHLTQLPDNGPLVPGLSRQAEAMHRQAGGAEVSVPSKSVATWLGSAEARAAWFKATEALGLTEIELSGRFRYTHQLWQEYFAALHLRDLPDTPDADWPDLTPPPLDSLEATVARLAAKDPLPGPGVNGWEEAIKIAVLLSDAPARWIAALRERNLPLAGRAARGCLARLSATSAGAAELDRLRADLLARSTDPATDLRLRIEAAEALGWIGDPRYEEGVGPTGQRYLVPKAAYWVRVPGGTYRIGTKGGAPWEQPVTPAPLQAFDMAFAPVTNAEYACFIEAKGYEIDTWWDEGLGRTWRREGVRNEELIERFRVEFRDLRTDFDAAVKKHYPQATESHVEGDLRKYAGWTEQQAEAVLEANFRAHPQREPNYWQDNAFNQPNQPVVGLCVFEARAYARWLAFQTGRFIRLPNEAEWEAAARGKERRRWPWRRPWWSWPWRMPKPWALNADPAHLRRTSPVGVFPASNSPDGLCDLSGNVGEWMNNAYEDRLTVASLTTDVPDGRALRAVRGGAWNGLSDQCRAGCRGWSPPDSRSYNLGFRLVCCPIPDPEPL